MRFPCLVIPAKAGTQLTPMAQRTPLGPRFCGEDEVLGGDDEDMGVE